MLLVFLQQAEPVAMLCLLGLIRLSITQMVPHILAAAAAVVVSPAAEFLLVALAAVLAAVAVQAAIVVFRR